MKKNTCFWFIPLLFLSILYPGRLYGQNYFDKTLQSAYRQFLSCFPDIIMGDSDVNIEYKPIPVQLVSNFIYLNGEVSENEIWYAIGKIENYHGLDLLICEYDLFREDEDSYDNHVDGRRCLLVYRDGKLLEEKRDGIGYTVGWHYYGEGGETNYDSWFDTDTTLIGRIHLSESESATGYQTPIETQAMFRHRIDEHGDPEFLELMQMEFSSPFFEMTYIEANKKYWLPDNTREYPSEEDKWPFSVGIPITDESFPKSEEAQLFFYLRKNGDGLETVLESRKQEVIIDRYVLGNERQENRNHTYHLNERTGTFQCPVIIKTSDGELELLPDGRFIFKN